MLKRTGFKSRIYVAPPRAPVVPIPAGEQRGVIRPVGGVVVAAPKQPPARSESYRRWVATLPCFGCGIEGYSQAAHPNYGRGLGQKSSDLDCFPLCCTRPGHQGCHVLHDTLVDVSLPERREIERVYVERMRILARAAGRPEIAT